MFPFQGESLIIIFCLNHSSAEGSKRLKFAWGLTKEVLRLKNTVIRPPLELSKVLEALGQKEISLDAILLYTGSPLQCWVAGSLRVKLKDNEGKKNAASRLLNVLRWHWSRHLYKKRRQAATFPPMSCEVKVQKAAIFRIPRWKNRSTCIRST